MVIDTGCLPFERCQIRSPAPHLHTMTTLKPNLLTLLATLIPIVSPLLARGETAVEAWARRYSNVTQSDDQASKVVTDNAANVIVAGYTDYGVTGRDILIIKFSSAGVGLWTNRYDGPGHSTDQPYSVAVAGNDDVVVAGESYGIGSVDYVTIKYSSAGVPLWTNRYNGPGNGDDYPSAVAVDAGGNAIVTGYSAGIGTSEDYATIKYSSAGVPVWTNRYNGPGNNDDLAYAGSVDANGNVFVTGFSTGIGTSGDYTTIAYSSAGVPSWTNRYNGPGNGDDYANAIALDGTNVYVTGYSIGAGLNGDYTTIAYSTSGVPLWTNRYDGPASGYDEAFAVTVAGGTNVIVTGVSTGVGTSGDYATIAYSNAGAPLWTNRYNGLNNGSDYAYAVVVGGGNVYVSGYSRGTGFHDDYATVAYSSAGVALWTNRYDGPGNGDDQARAAAADASGNVYVTGGSFFGVSRDWATIGYSSAGTVMWLARYDGLANDQDQPQAVAVGSDGSVYVTGTSVGSGVYNYDYATIAYSSAGVALWTNRYNGPANGTDAAAAVAVDGTNVYVTGSSFTSLGSDSATIAYSRTGETLWIRIYGFDGAPNGNHDAIAVAIAGGTNVIVTGSSSGIDTAADYATIAYSSAGVPLWTNRYDGPANAYDQASALATDSSGKVYVTGHSPGSVSGDDYATIAYSSAGVPLWTNRYNGPGNGDDQANAVAVGTGGNVYVTGYSFGNGSADDYATIAYSSAGVPLWTNRYNGPANNYDAAQAVVVDGSGRVYVTGSSDGSSGGADFTTIAYSSAGLPLWTNRYNGPFNGPDQPLTSRSLAVAGDGSVVVVGSSAGGYVGLNDYATVKYVPESQLVPQLAITLTNGNTAKVSWPFPSTGFNLQQNSNLNTTNWISPSETVSSNSSNKFILVSPLTGNRFYRLIYQ